MGNGIVVVDICTLFMLRSLTDVCCASLHSNTSHGHSTFAARETGDVGGGGDCLSFLALLALLVKVDKGRGDG